MGEDININTEKIDGIESIEGKLDKQEQNENGDLESILDKINDSDTERKETPKVEKEEKKENEEDSPKENIAGYAEARHTGFPYNANDGQKPNELALKIQNAGQGAPENAA